MKKKIKILLFLLVFISILLVSLPIVIVSLFPKSIIDNRNKIYNDTYNGLNNYVHQNVAFYEYNRLYYENQLIRLDFNTSINYVDEYGFVFSDYNMMKYKIYNYDGIIDSFDRDVINGDSSSIFRIGDNLYYYKYNYQNDFYEYYEYDFHQLILKQITKEAYYSYRDGNNYTINMEESSIEIINNQINNSLLITINDICSNDNFSWIKKIEYYKICDYQIIDDLLYIQLYNNSFDIVIEYNINSNEMKLYDWLSHKKVDLYSIHAKFYVFKDELPCSLNSYFVSY